MNFVSLFQKKNHLSLRYEPTFIEIQFDGRASVIWMWNSNMAEEGKNAA